MFLKQTNHKNLLRIIFFFSLISIFSLISRAAPGDLDTTFDTDGKTTTDFNLTNDSGQKVAIQSDGKIIVGGTVLSSFDFSLGRYNTDGTLDMTFGNNGKVRTELSNLQQLFAIAIQSDGKIVAVGTGNAGAPFATAEIHRYNTDGSLDTTFGGDGTVNNVIGIKSTFFDVTIQTDGKIVAAGEVSFGSSFTFLAARYNSDGTLDTSFNGDGIYSSPFGNFVNYRAYAVVIQNNGKIILGGDSGLLIDNPDSGAAVTLNADGSPIGSGSVGNIGVFVRDIAIQSDGKIVYAGQFFPTNSHKMIGIARHNADGSTDTGFGLRLGRNFADFGSESSGTSLAIQSDGRIIVGGYAFSNGKKFALTRFNTNGFLDVGFGSSGKVITQIGSGDSQINGIALQTDGKIVAAGDSFNGTDTDFAVARYLYGNSATLPNRTTFDFDGDGRADTAVFRNGIWYVLQSLDNSLKAIAFGQTGDEIVPADYDGDGRTETAVFRPSTGSWYYLRTTDGSFVVVQFGTSNSIPRPGDFDGDGKADIAVFYPPTGYWFVIESQSGNIRTKQFGETTDIPVFGDFDSDNKADIAVFRPSNGTWFWSSSSNNSFNSFQFGTNGDLPLTSDFDGDGKTDFAVFRPSMGSWYINRSTQGFTGINFGINSDRPVPADYDGDGKTDIGVFRNGNWYKLQSSNNGFAAVSWGQSGDIAIPSAFVP